MIGLVLFGGLCGSLNNVFVHMSGQNIGNEMRKDCFRKIMTFSFPQLDKFGAGSLVTRVTNDITQVQNFVSQFVRGMSLSGGQKQRISIARAVLKSAEIIIFDDSTSALDLKTEAELYRALQRANPDSTKIIIAQRIASVRNADRIVVLENGSILACAPHEKLMETCSVYRDIYQSQIGKEDNIA